MRAPSIGQFIALLNGIFANVDWDSFPGNPGALQEVIDRCPSGIPSQLFTNFLVDYMAVINKSVDSTIDIDRENQHDIDYYMTNDSELKGLWKVESQNSRSLSIVKLDLTTVLLVPALKGNVTQMRGDKCLTILQQTSNYVPLDMPVFWAIACPETGAVDPVMPSWWRRQVDGEYLNVHFPGSVLLDPKGERVVLTHMSDGDSGWKWGYTCLNNEFGMNDVFAVVEA